jgi:hypothetical protein
MTIWEAKESSTVPVTSVLLELTLADETILRWASHRCELAGQSYEPRLLTKYSRSWKFTQDITSESSGAISLELADPDGAVAQLFQRGLLTGAQARVFAAVLEDGLAQTSTVLMTGLLDTVQSVSDEVVSIRILNRLSAVRSQFPPLRIQKQCAWTFPKNQAEREQSISLGEDGRYSGLFRCGYSPDIPGGVGNLDNGVPFTSCGYTRQDCQARGMFSSDSVGNPTHRFTGIEFVPPSIQVRGHGESSGRLSNLVQLDTRYNDVVPAVYGQGWLQAPVIFARNDGNLTRCEVLLGLGEIEQIVQVVADGYEIPQGIDGQNMTSTGWYNVVSLGNRNGALNLGFTDGAGNPVGDPYGSMAYLNLVLPNRINDGKRPPKVEVLLKGLRLPVLDAQGALADYQWSSNPAWILCDILRRTGWKLAELDLPSFVATAAYCDELVDAFDANGQPVQVKRFEQNLILRRRYSVGELLRSIRLGSLLQIHFTADGKLALRPEATLAQQHPTAVVGSNAVESIAGGWPVYAFGDGMLSEGNILLDSRLNSRLKIYSRPSNEVPNRVHFEIQDALNEFRQDSISIADVDDVQLRRHEVAQALPVVGIPNFPQAQRICQTWLNKAISGNVFLELQTTMKGLHIRPGDLISVSHVRYGFEQTLFRVIETEVSPDLHQVAIVAQLHQDHWYSDQASIRYDRTRIYSWRNSSARAVCGTIIADGQIQFNASEQLAVNSEGVRSVLLTVPFVRPPAETVSSTGIPLVRFNFQIEEWPGGLKAGAYFYAFSSIDAEGRESGLSSLVPVHISGSGSGYRVELRGISMPSSAAAFNVYRGSSPQQMLRIAAGLPISDVFVDDGLASQTVLPPDGNYVKVHAWYRQIHQVFQPVTGWTTTSVSGTNLNLTPNRWVGHKVVVRDTQGRVQERGILAHDENVIEVDRPWDLSPAVTSTLAIVSAGWHFAAESETDLVTVDLPLLPTTSFEINLRSVSRDGRELDAAIAPSLIWQIGVGSTAAVDTAEPPAPFFSVSLVEGGTLALEGISFPNLDQVGTIYAGQFGILYWDELTAPTELEIGTPISDQDTLALLTGNWSGVTPGRLLQFGEEIAEVTAVNSAQNQVTLTRGLYGSTPVAHSAGVPVYLLNRQDQMLSFVPGYFRSAAAVGYRHVFRSPNVRLAAADLVLYNRIGPSARGEALLTGSTDQGLRTLSGGQILLNVHGYLAIEASAGNSIVLERQTVVRDIFAFVQEAPAGGAIELLLKLDGQPYGELVIENGNFTSASFSGFNRWPLTAGAVLSLDILNVPSSAAGLPGRDLTVCIQI